MTIYKSDNMQLEVVEDSKYTICAFIGETISCFDLNQFQCCTFFDCGKIVSLKHTGNDFLRLIVDKKETYFKSI